MIADTAMLVVPLTTLAVLDDVAVVALPFPVTVCSVTGSLRVLTSGTHTVQVKDDGGTVLGSVTWTAAGHQMGSVSVPGAANKLHIGISSLGVGVVDCCVTIVVQFNHGERR